MGSVHKEEKELTSAEEDELIDMTDEDLVDFYIDSYTEKYLLRTDEEISEDEKREILLAKQRRFLSYIENYPEGFILPPGDTPLEKVLEMVNDYKRQQFRARLEYVKNNGGPKCFLNDKGEPYVPEFLVRKCSHCPPDLSQFQLWKPTFPLPKKPPVQESDSVPSSSNSATDSNNPATSSGDSAEKTKCLRVEDETVNQDIAEDKNVSEIFLTSGQLGLDKSMKEIDHEKLTKIEQDMNSTILQDSVHNEKSDVPVIVINEANLNIMDDEDLIVAPVSAAYISGDMSLCEKPITTDVHENKTICKQESENSSSDIQPETDVKQEREVIELSAAIHDSEKHSSLKDFIEDEAASFISPIAITSEILNVDKTAVEQIDVKNGSEIHCIVESEKVKVTDMDWQDCADVESDNEEHCIKSQTSPDVDDIKIVSASEIPIQNFIVESVDQNPSLDQFAGKGWSLVSMDSIINKNVDDYFLVNINSIVASQELGIKENSVNLDTVKKTVIDMKTVTPELEINISEASHNVLVKTDNIETCENIDISDEVQNEKLIVTGDMVGKEECTSKETEEKYELEESEFERNKEETCKETSVSVEHFVKSDIEVKEDSESKYETDIISGNDEALSHNVIEKTDDMQTSEVIDIPDEAQNEMLIDTSNIMAVEEEAKSKDFERKCGSEEVDLNKDKTPKEVCESDIDFAMKSKLDKVQNDVSVATSDMVDEEEFISKDVKQRYESEMSIEKNRDETCEETSVSVEDFIKSDIYLKEDSESNYETDMKSGNVEASSHHVIEKTDDMQTSENISSPIKNIKEELEEIIEKSKVEGNKGETHEKRYDSEKVSGIKSNIDLVDKEIESEEECIDNDSYEYQQRPVTNEETSVSEGKDFDIGSYTQTDEGNKDKCTNRTDTTNLAEVNKLEAKHSPEQSSFINCENYTPIDSRKEAKEEASEIHETVPSEVDKNVEGSETSKSIECATGTNDSVDDTITVASPVTSKALLSTESKGDDTNNDVVDEVVEVEKEKPAGMHDYVVEAASVEIMCDESKVKKMEDPSIDSSEKVLLIDNAERLKEINDKANHDIDEESNTSLVEAVENETKLETRLRVETITEVCAVDENSESNVTEISSDSVGGEISKDKFETANNLKTNIDKEDMDHDVDETNHGANEENKRSVVEAVENETKLETRLQVETITEVHTVDENSESNATESSCDSVGGEISKDKFETESNLKRINDEGETDHVIDEENNASAVESVENEAKLETITEVIDENSEINATENSGDSAGGGEISKDNFETANNLKTNIDKEAMDHDVDETNHGAGEENKTSAVKAVGETKLETRLQVETITEVHTVDENSESNATESSSDSVGGEISKDKFETANNLKTNIDKEAMDHDVDETNHGAGEENKTSAVKAVGETKLETRLQVETITEVHTVDENSESNATESSSDSGGGGEISMVKFEPECNLTESDETKVLPADTSDNIFENAGDADDASDTEENNIFENVGDADNASDTEEKFDVETVKVKDEIEDEIPFMQECVDNESDEEVQVVTEKDPLSTEGMQTNYVDDTENTFYIQSVDVQIDEGMIHEAEGETKPYRGSSTRGKNSKSSSQVKVSRTSASSASSKFKPPKSMVVIPKIKILVKKDYGKESPVPGTSSQEDTSLSAWDTESYEAPKIMSKMKGMHKKSSPPVPKKYFKAETGVPVPTKSASRTSTSSSKKGRMSATSDDDDEEYLPSTSQKKSPSKKAGNKAGGKSTKRKRDSLTSSEQPAKAPKFTDDEDSQDVQILPPKQLEFKPIKTGDVVFARWKDKNYYAGKVEQYLPSKKKWRILFHDGARLDLTDKVIINVDHLPINLEVLVFKEDSESKGDYYVGTVIDVKQPEPGSDEVMYCVSFEGGDKYNVRHRHLGLQEENIKQLKQMCGLPVQRR